MTIPREAERQEAEIPESALVRCPMRLNVFVHARRCDACQYCAGLTRAFNNPNLPFERQFMIRCAFPVDRELVALQG